MVLFFCLFVFWGGCFCFCFLNFFQQDVDVLTENLDIFLLRYLPELTNFPNKM